MPKNTKSIENKEKEEKGKSHFSDSNTTSRCR